ncbi:Protein CBG06075 [Caenorhabditis briggsae]|uniref:Protein CBG06075 n=1 Tax=Caenorhabditis briggsae TaxID=6238 RepID=A8X0Y7_CAEBR|nr:Protein CBG06075 [Caenorhabditis briggsae]CAP26297.2 Protein CBG06075 [Caenorhabditis briggsae]
MSDVEMDSGSDGSEMEDLDESIQKVKDQMKEDDRDVNLANQLLVLLRKNGDFPELEQKRKRFVEWAPLTPLNWINWIEDFRKQEPEPSVEDVEKMFERAIFDENDVTIWAERVMYSYKCAHDERSDKDFEYCRDVSLKSLRGFSSTQIHFQTCEKALTAIGNRYDAGGHIWMLFLGYELKHFRSRLKFHNLGIQYLFPEYINSSEFQQQADQVAHLFKRALRCPTDQLEEIYSQSEQFCSDYQQDSHVTELKKLYDATMRQKEQLAKFQILIDNHETKKMGLKQFFEHEKKSGMPARVQMAHERMVAELSDDEDAWCAYGAWTEYELKLPQISVEIYERALRHCPYSYVLHQQTLLALERAQKPDEVIDRLWAKAKNNVINAAEEGRGLYRTYAFLLRRRIFLAGSKDFSPMAEVFDEGAAILKEWFTMAWDPNAEYRQMQAYFYASLMKDMDKCRKIWNDILASGFGRFAGKWLEAVRIERQFGDKENARRFLNKALNSVSDNINEIYLYYVQFEREEGTLSELDQVLEKVNAQASHRANRPQKKLPEKPYPSEKDNKDLKKRTAGGEPIVKKVKSADGGFKAPLPPTALKKPTPPSTQTTTSSTAPSVSFSTPKSQPGTEDARTIFVSNLDFTTTEDDIRQAIQGVTSIRFARKAHTDETHRGFAYVVMENEEKTRIALQKDRVSVKGRPMFVSEIVKESKRIFLFQISANDPEKRVGFKFSTGLEKAKIFVRNVHFQATDEELLFGPVKSVRRVTHRDGKPKGVAFIDFESESSAQQCVASGDKLVLRERDLEVAISNPPAKKDKHHPHVGFAGKVASEEDGGRKGHAAKLQLVPRAIAAKAPQITARMDAMDVSEKPASSKASTSSTSASKPMSNDQFRQMFMRN